MTKDYILENAIRDSSMLYVGKKIMSNFPMNGSDSKFYSLKAKDGIVFLVRKLESGRFLTKFTKSDSKNEWMNNVLSSYMTPTFIDTFEGLTYNRGQVSNDLFYMNEHGILLLDDAREKARDFFIETDNVELYPRNFLKEGSVKDYFENPPQETIIRDRTEHQKDLYEKVKDSEKDLIMRGNEKGQYFMAFPIKDYYVLEFDHNRATFIYRRDTFEELIDIFGNDIPIDPDDYDHRIVHNELRSIRMVWFNTIMNYINDNQKS